MLKITEKAQAKLRELIANSDQPVLGIRVIAEAKSPLKAEYGLSFVQEGEQLPEDTVVSFEGFDVYIDPESLPFVEEATLDFVENMMGGGFRIDAPPRMQPGTKLEGPVAEKLQRLFEEQINPALALHGGSVRLIDVKDNKVYIELGGGCRGCGMVDVTLKQGIEVMIKQAVPEITEVLDVTDHASGTNPYYQPSK
ncbi:MAG: iron-sulfur cluster assembly accessory protein [Calditrichaeota bacterium]|nr:MAG: iron-sulfur cluster assembly accessory protein [Calditrichota bacterium]